MSEYNIQMNKYNASKAGYDQLYPATKIANVDGLGMALQNKADTTKKTTVTLSTNWTGDVSPYTQTVIISGTTVNSKVDLQPDATAIAQMLDDGTVALYIANDNGVLTAYAIGEKPTVELTIQATITEVSA